MSIIRIEKEKIVGRIETVSSISTADIEVIKTIYFLGIKVYSIREKLVPTDTVLEV